MNEQRIFRILSLFFYQEKTIVKEVDIEYLLKYSNYFTPFEEGKLCISRAICKEIRDQRL